MMRNRRGFTLIELLISVAVIAVIATLAAPSFSDFILVQRLKGVNAQLVTDLQFARSEAAVRSTPVRVQFGTDVDGFFTCYALYTGPAASCDCTATPVCGAGSQEVRSVRVNTDQRVTFSTRFTEFAYDHSTGRMVLGGLDSSGGAPRDFIINTYIDLPRTLRTSVMASGRPSVCSPGTSMGAVPC